MDCGDDNENDVMHQNDENFPLDVGNIIFVGDKSTHGQSLSKFQIESENKTKGTKKIKLEITQIMRKRKPGIPMGL